VTKIETLPVFPGVGRGLRISTKKDSKCTTWLPAPYGTVGSLQCQEQGTEARALFARTQGPAENWKTTRVCPQELSGFDRDSSVGCPGLDFLHGRRFPDSVVTERFGATVKL
jgi:hypothetical protein